MKTNKTQKQTGGLPTLTELKAAKAAPRNQVEVIPAEKTAGRSGLLVSVFIPEPHVGLFRAYALLNGMSTRKFARHAVFRYLAGEDCQQSLDNAINQFLATLPEC